MRRYPLLALLVLLPTLATAQITIRNGLGADTMNQLQQLIKQNTTPEQQAKLQQGLVSGIILGCVERKTGADVAQRYYKELDAIGQQTQAYCKAGQYDTARLYVLQALRQRQNDAPLQSAQQCYDQHTQEIATLSEPMRSDVPKYVNWSRNPAAAEREMTNKDICKNAKA